MSTPHAVAKHFAFMSAPATKSRPAPKSPFVFESWGEGYFHVKRRAGRASLGFVAKVKGGWEAESDRSGGSIYATLPTRDEAAQWLADNKR